MQLNPMASWVLVSIFLIESLVVIGLLLVLVVLLYKGLAQLEALTTRMEPSLDKADAVLKVTTEKISSVGERLEEILTHGEAVAETVYEKVDRTSTAVQKTIHAPIIRLNSLAAGISRGLNTFTRLQQTANSNGTTPTQVAYTPHETINESNLGAERVAIPAGGAPGRES